MTQRLPIVAADGRLSELAKTDTLDKPVTLWETVFAGLSTGALSTGDVTLDGRTWTIANGSGGGAASIVATGLQLKPGTGAETAATLKANGSTDLASILGKANWARGRWGFWFRTASFDFSATTAGYWHGGASGQ